MILDVMKNAGLFVEKDSKTPEYAVIFHKPKQCDKCSSKSVQSRGYADPRSVIAIVDSQIQKITISDTI